MKKNLMMIGAVVSATLVSATLVSAALALAGCQSGPAAQDGGTAAAADAAPRDLKEMVLVPGGTFLMGTGAVGASQPIHEVTVSSFLIGKYEVTVGAFREFVEASGYVTTAESTGKGGWSSVYNWMVVPKLNWKNTLFKQTEEEPVCMVTWYDAVAYCNWRSGAEGFTPAYIVDGTEVSLVPGADGYRLPTEAEWEYAARGGDGSPGNYNYSGGNTLNSVAWNGSNSNMRPHEVGKKEPNGLGIHDMSGNVWEFCWDWYAPYSADAQTDPLGPSSPTTRVYRGCSFRESDVQWVLVAWRHEPTKDMIGDNTGFRVARSAH
ncbi:MAG: formylglycine-generating enzyme family protein [Treponema sp.]|jgi:formylglycine-generating enzyme required for sulfatase activity|nr:formylglycine-generating enzyme family protein [Treponema sp.]